MTFTRTPRLSPWQRAILAAIPEGGYLSHFPKGHATHGGYVIWTAEGHQVRRPTTDAGKPIPVATVAAMIRFGMLEERETGRYVPYTHRDDLTPVYHCAGHCGALVSSDGAFCLTCASRGGAA